MCLGGGGGYQPPQMKQAPAPTPGPASPDDKVNDETIANANDRAAQEAERNQYNPDKPKPKPQSEKY